MAVVRRKRGWRTKIIEVGGGTPPPPFNPGDVAEVINWYDVTDPTAIVVNAGRVEQLTDKKGSRNITQSLSLYPTYSASGGGNNNAYLTVDPTQYIYDDLGSFPGSAGAIAFAAFRIKDLTPIDTGGGDYLHALISYFQRGYGLVMNLLDAGYAPYFLNGGNYYSDKFNNGATTDWQIVSFKSQDANNTSVQYNQQPIGQSCRTGFGVMGPTNISLGFLGYSANFEFSELVIADTSISQANVTNIQNYLIQKYTPTINQYILLYGDSVTNGSCNVTQDWSYLLAASLGVQLSNYGWGGTIAIPNNGSTGVAGRNFNDVYQTANVSNKPNWLHVGFGINDTNQGGINATWKILYKGLVQDVINYGYNADSIIIAIPPSTTIRQALMATTNTYISQIASELGIRLFDANQYFIDYATAHGQPDQDYLFGDALHPNATGNLAYRDGMLQTML